MTRYMCISIVLFYLDILVILFVLSIFFQLVVIPSDELLLREVARSSHGVSRLCLLLDAALASPQQGFSSRIHQQRAYRDLRLYSTNCPVQTSLLQNAWVLGVITKPCYCSLSLSQLTNPIDYSRFHYLKSYLWLYGSTIVLSVIKC